MKDLPETTAQNGPPSREAKENVVTASSSPKGAAVQHKRTPSLRVIDRYYI
ncbi:MAG TPA: hypothetical protein VJ821_01355 [Anaerolineales bacterium]|nr:hypothetical protein [Anaerolineales bacterium]